MESLLHTIQNTPIIDHHAHNLLLSEELEAREFLSITTEAGGDALAHTKSSLAHLRAVQQLSQILDCAPTWDRVVEARAARRRRSDEVWARECFHGIETVLLDDGLDASAVHPWSWHDRLTASPCKRIVRIERVAEELFESHFKRRPAEASQRPGQLSILSSWIDLFCQAIRDACLDPNVAGFKSVICYRTGLAIPSFETLQKQMSEGSEDDLGAIGLAIQRWVAQETPLRLEHQCISPYFVHIAASIISGHPGPKHTYKPLQFHTGLGDNDITLSLSSPSNLQAFIKAHPKVPIVLLHASYPYTREAGYLATVYKNVYLDIGEVFPMVSQEGQESVIRESLELCPSEKLMWSTDGHWFPETYLLAVRQVRQAMEQKKVLRSNVERNMLTISQAIRIVQDIFFSTSNQLYNLNLALSPPQQLCSIKKPDSDNSIFEKFLSEHPTVKYLRLQWLDYTATLRLRVLPVREARSMFRRQKSIGITKAVLGLLQTDEMAPSFTPIGEYELVPCLDSLKLGEREGYATVQGEFREKDGSIVSLCPRSFLRRQVERASSKGISYMMGFEIEVVFMRYDVVHGACKYGTAPAGHGHSWSSANALLDPEIMALIEDILDALQRSQIEVQQFHPESAPGQYEIVTAPLAPLAAVDTLVATRDIIYAIASRHSMRATLVPKPYADTCGTGAHVHLSMTPEEQHPAFYAGVLKHLRALSAFSLSNSTSYRRMVDSAWCGSRYVAWGTQNRETPLRKIEASHWEFKWMDGFANAYLTLGAILAAGLQGVLDSEELRLKDCQDDPATLSAEERSRLGIKDMLPTNFWEALVSLKDDVTMRRLLGDDVIEAYFAVKQCEGKMMDDMDEETLRRFLIERY